MAPTRSALERMTQKCSDHCSKLGLSFNTKKSQVIVFSKKQVNCDSLKPIAINGKPIDYVDSVKYLGTTIHNEKGLTFSSTNNLLSFYCASNSILTAIRKPSEEVLLQLLYSNCIPTLTYACAIKEYPPRQMQVCNTAVDNALRRIFGF